MTTQSNMPTTSRICQSRPRSRYSQPCAPIQNQGPLAGMIVLDAGGLADQAADDDEHHGAEQGNGQLVLVLRLAAGDHRGDEDAHGQEAGGDEEQRQLQVPHARQVVGEPVGQMSTP